MARSKSKHVRLIMRRRKQYKQRMKRRAADVKTAAKAPPAKKTPAKAKAAEHASPASS